MSTDSPSNSMRYSLLGEDTSTNLEKLETFKGEVDWSYLKPHYERGCLFFVDVELDITVVGEAFSRDDSAAVKGWLKTGELVKIEAMHAFQWEDNVKQQFEALVVSPFVLCCTIS